MNANWISCRKSEWNRFFNIYFRIQAGNVRILQLWFFGATLALHIMQCYAIGILRSNQSSGKCELSINASIMLFAIYCIAIFPEESGLYAFSSTGNDNTISYQSSKCLSPPCGIVDTHQSRNKLHFIKINMYNDPSLKFSRKFFQSWHFMCLAFSSFCLSVYRMRSKHLVASICSWYNGIDLIVENCDHSARTFEMCIDSNSVG